MMNYFVFASAVLTAMWINETEAFHQFLLSTPFNRHHLAHVSPSSSKIIAATGTITSTSSSHRRVVFRMGTLDNESDESIYLNSKTTNSKNHALIIEDDQKVKSSFSTSVQDRRKAIETILTSGSTITATTALSFILWSTNLQQASAATSPPSTTSITDNTNLLDKMASKFKRVPAFALVDGETGTPFMILKNTGVATGYFFTSYEGAQTVLDGAKRDAEKDEGSKEMWSKARISAVSLEFALKLGKGRPKAMAQNGVKYGTVYDIIPDAADLNVASSIDRSGVYTEQGRVPLFYMDSFETGPGEEGGENRIPVFLTKEDLLLQYTKKFPNESKIPPIQVFDLVDAFDTMMNPEFTGGRKGPVDSRLAMNLLPIPSSDTRKKAVEVEKARGKTSPYNLGEMIAVGGVR